jgi:hypothetical protein
MRPLLAAAVCLALAVACGSSPPPGRTPSGGYVSCGSDADCVVTNWNGCCGCCPSEPRAVPATKLEEQKTRCGTCAPCSDRLDCPKVQPISSFVAACKDGTCAAVPK